MTLYWLPISDVLCGFDADPMQGRATVVADYTPTGEPWPAPDGVFHIADGVNPDEVFESFRAQRAAAAALGEVTP